MGAIQYRQTFADAYGYNVGATLNHYLVREVAAAEEKSTTTAQKNRLALA